MNNGTMANQLEVPAVDADGKLVEDAVSEKKWVNGLNDMKDLYEKRFLPGENTLTAKDADTVQLFAEGEAAFLIDGFLESGSLL